MEVRFSIRLRTGFNAEAQGGFIPVLLSVGLIFIYDELVSQCQVLAVVFLIPPRIHLSV